MAAPLLCIAAAIGCGQKQAAPEPVSPLVLNEANESTLFPAAAEDRWVYGIETSIQDGSGVPHRDVGEVQFVVSQAQDEGKIHRATIDVRDGIGVQDQTMWEIRPDGIFEVMGGLSHVKFDPPQPLMRFPIDTNSTISWAGTGPTADETAGHSTMQFNLSKAPQIDTDSGVVSGVCVESSGDFQNATTKGKIESSAWFQPGVGLVRLVQKITAGQRVTITTMKLKSTNLRQ